jgi:hypothetical protein
MNGTIALDAVEFAAKLGADVAAALGWADCTATAVDSTGGGCTATRCNFVAWNWKASVWAQCSLVLVDDEHGALDGDWLARAEDGDAHRDGERAIVAVYNGNDWNETGTDYTGTDLLSNYAIADYASLVSRCCVAVGAWSRWCEQ